MKVVAAGLPNISGISCFGSGDTIDNAGQLSGAFYYSQEASRVYTSNPPSNRTTVMAFDASRSNDVYGASGTVQPPATVLIPQIKF